MNSYLKEASRVMKLDSIDENPSLKLVKQKTGLDPSAIIIIGGFIMLILSMIISVNSWIIALVCFIVPSFYSFLALQSKEQNDDIIFLMYWIVFSMLQVIAPILEMFMSPFLYMIFRIVFTILLLHPKTKLASKIYNSVIKPMLIKHQKTIDEVVQKGKQKIKKQAQENFNKLQ